MNDMRLRTPSHIKRLLARTINDLVKGKITEERARAIAYLCNNLLNAIEKTELEVKIDELEQLVKEMSAKNE